MPELPQSPRSAREWLSILARYREPSTRRSLFELAATLIPFVALWALAWGALSVSPWLALALAMVNGSFLVRIFIIQHDCGHGAATAPAGPAPTTSTSTLSGNGSIAASMVFGGASG